jgi:hypothetical protein
MSRFYIYPTHGKVIALNSFYYGQFRHAFIYEPGIPSPWYVLFKGKLTRRTKEHVPKDFLMLLVLMGVNL